VLEGVRRDPSLAFDFMFGSTLRARRLTAFPAPRWDALRPTELDEKTRRTLVARAGDAISGKQVRSRPLGRVPCGALVFAYEKGIHRFLKKTKLARVGEVVLYEPVLTSKLERQSGVVLSCVPTFCELVPAPITRELDRRLGLGT
jgi:hypothetical protein